jgi:hypothetical protein
MDIASVFGGNWQGFLKVGGGGHCEAIFAEAIPNFGREIASTGKERRFRNDTAIEIATLRRPWGQLGRFFTAPSAVLRTAVQNDKAGVCLDGLLPHGCHPERSEGYWAMTG